MLNQEAFNIFTDKEVLRKLSLISGTSGFFILPDDDVCSDISPNFGLNIDEEVLLLRDTSFWNNKDQGCVVTDWGISFIADNDNVELVQIPWSKVDHVEYKNQQMLFFTSKDRSNYYSIHIYSFLKNELHYNSYGQFLAELFSKMADTDSEATDEEIANSFWEHLDNGDLDFAESIAETYISSDNEKDSGYYMMSCVKLRKAECLREKASTMDSDDEKQPLNDEADKLQEESNMYCDMALEIAEGDDWRALIYLQKAECVGPLRARNCYIAAMTSEEHYPEALEKFQDHTKSMLHMFDEHLKPATCFKDVLGDNTTEEDIKEWMEIIKEESFVNISKEYNIPQCLFIAQDDNHLKGCFDPTGAIFHVYTLAKRPKEIKFPLGHPLANTLYIPHPFDEEYYLPYETAEKTLFLDKIREFCYLTQCLGATRISFTSLKGEKITADVNNEIHGDGDMNFKIHSGNFNGDYSNQSHYDNDRKDSVDLVQEFSPNVMPYLPDKLAWYKHEISWQQLVRQRLEGNLLHYELKIASQETVNMSSNQKMALSASYKNLLMGINLNYNMSINTNVNTYEESEWKISGS